MSDEPPDTFASLDTPSDTVESLREQRRDLIDALVEAQGVDRVVWCDYNAGPHVGWTFADEPVPQVGDIVLCGDPDPGFIWSFAQVRIVTGVAPRTHAGGAIVDMKEAKSPDEATEGPLSDAERDALRRVGVDPDASPPPQVTVGITPEHLRTGRIVLHEALLDGGENLQLGSAVVVFDGEAAYLPAEVTAHRGDLWEFTLLSNLEELAEMRRHGIEPAEEDIIFDLTALDFELRGSLSGIDRDWAAQTARAAEAEIRRLRERDRISTRRIARLHELNARAAQLIADHGIPLDEPTDDDGDGNERRLDG